MMVYVDDLDEAGSALKLTPTEAGANAMLLAPFDNVVFDRARVDGGVTYVAPSQAAAHKSRPLPGRGRGCA